MNKLITFIPFLFRGKKQEELKKLLTKRLPEIQWQEIGMDDAEKEPFLMHTTELLNKVIRLVAMENSEPEEDLQPMDSSHVGAEFFLFPTGIGFLQFEYRYRDSGEIETLIDSMQKQIYQLEEYLRYKTGELAQEKVIIDCLDMEQQIELLSKKCYWMFVTQGCNLTRYDDYSFRIQHLNERNLSVNGRFEQAENPFDHRFPLDKSHNCLISIKSIGLDIQKSEAEVNFSQFEIMLKNIFLLLQHEKCLLVGYKQEIINGSCKERKKYKRLKTEILDCLSKYTFEIISDETICQNVYMKYKSLLHLTEMEETMRDLIFTIDDEIAKQREKGLTILTILLSLLGLVSVFSGVLDIISFFMKMNG